MPTSRTTLAVCCHKFIFVSIASRTIETSQYKWSDRFLHITSRLSRFASNNAVGFHRSCGQRCTERSFSCTRVVRTFVPSSMKEDRLSALSNMTIENDVAEHIEYEMIDICVRMPKLRFITGVFKSGNGRKLDLWSVMCYLSRQYRINYVNSHGILTFYYIFDECLNACVWSKVETSKMVQHFQFSIELLYDYWTL